MKVNWTAAALAQLRDIHAFVGRSSPQYASKTVDKLTRRSQLIAKFPRSGRIVPEANNVNIRLPRIQKLLKEDLVAEASWQAEEIREHGQTGSGENNREEYESLLEVTEPAEPRLSSESLSLTPGFSPVTPEGDASL